MCFTKAELAETTIESLKAETCECSSSMGSAAEGAPCGSDLLNPLLGCPSIATTPW